MGLCCPARFGSGQNNPQTYLAVGGNSRHVLLLTTITNRQRNHDHALQTNPTLFIHSVTDPNSDNTEWLSLVHDQTDGVIATGKGDVVLDPATDEVRMNPGTKADGFSVQTAEVQTTDAAETACKTLALLDENTYHFEVIVIGVESDGSNRASYQYTGTAYRTGAGGATLQGAVVYQHERESDANWDAQLDMAGNNAVVNVTGVAATTIEWGCTVRSNNMSN